MNDKRVAWIDVLKGSAIILVILGHAIADSWLKVWIYTFHLGLFFFSTGYVFNAGKYGSVKEFILARVKNILIPYIKYSLLTVLFLLIWNIFKGMLDGEPVDYSVLSDGLIGMVVQIRRSRYEGYCWFLAMLFVADVCYFVILRYIKKELFKHAVIIALFAVGFAYNSYCSCSLPWHIDVVPIVLLFFDLGSTVKQKNVNLNNWMMGVGALLLSFSIAYYEYTIHVRTDIFEHSYGNIVLFVLGNLSGITAFSWLAHMLQNVSAIKYIGRNSLSFYALHRPIFFYPIRLVLQKVFGKLVKEGEMKENMFMGFLLTILTVGAIYIYNQIKDKAKILKASKQAKSL